MIPTLILSKDRPAQLHLLLNSLEKNAKDLFDITVIYTYSNKEYLDGYSKIDDYYKVKWIYEKDCNEQFYFWLNRVDHPLVNFFTDDCIFYRPNEVWEDDLLKLFSMQNIWTFTYRLGYNIEIQDYTRNNPTDRPRMFVEKYNSLVWDYTQVKKDHSFGWECGLDGYVWRTDNLKKLLNSENFDHFTRLEGLMIRKHREKRPQACMMGCPFKSNVLVQQINVTHLDPHHNIGRFTPSLTDLNNEFLNGKRVLLEKMDFSTVNCTHNEIPFIME